MDSQHRHDLQQNELGKITNRALPFFEKHGMQVMLGLGVVVVALIAGSIWYGKSTVSTTESWTQLDRVLHEPNASANDFADVADKHPGTHAAAWATLKEADDYLKTGMQAAFTNRDASLTDLKKAQETYQKLIADSPGITSEIKERSLFGLARCLETTSDGNTDDAIQTYKRLITEFPELIFKGIANDRIKTLEAPEAKEFYAWFHQQKPKPLDPLRSPFKRPVKSPHDADDSDESMEKPDDPGSSDGDAESPADATPEPPGQPKPDEAAPAEKSDDAEKPSESPAKPESK